MWTDAYFLLRTVTDFLIPAILIAVVLVAAVHMHFADRRSKRRRERENDRG